MLQYRGAKTCGGEFRCYFLGHKHWIVLCEEIGVRCPAATDDRTVLIKHGALCLDREYLVGIYIKVMHIAVLFSGHASTLEKNHG